ncbi:MAG: transcription antitermination factor NusB [Candidatus Zixiibacteriota bacterium]|nr:MAG: transcription antitermination factor NusB [candidate division Zixibacteria bacterium]
MSEASPRRRARELVLKALYAEAVGEWDYQEIESDIIADDGLSPRALKFARSLYTAVRENRKWADEIISSLAENWKLERIATVDRSIMQIALTELKETPDVPVKAVINEALELAKTFSTSDSASFINGILDHYVKDTSDGRVI